MLAAITKEASMSTFAAYRTSQPAHPRPSSTAWHATSTPSAATCAGLSTRHRSFAKGHRGWNAHPGGRRDRARQLPPNRRPRPSDLPQIRDRIQQQPGIRMPRPGKDRLRRPKLDDTPKIHNPQPVRHMPDHRKVMADEQVRQPKPRVAGRASDSGFAPAPTHPSALVGSSHTRKSGSLASARAIEIRCRCPPENSCGYFSPSRTVNPTCASNEPTRPCTSSRRCRQPERAYRLSNNIRHSPPRVQRGIRVLKNHVHSPPQRRLRPSHRQRSILKQDIPLARLIKPNRKPSDGGLAAA